RHGGPSYVAGDFLSALPIHGVVVATPVAALIRSTRGLPPEPPKTTCASCWALPSGMKTIGQVQSLPCPWEPPEASGLLRKRISWGSLSSTTSGGRVPSLGEESAPVPSQNSGLSGATRNLPVFSMTAK